MQPAYFIQEGLQMKNRMENQSFLQLKAAQKIGVGWGGRKPNIVGICVIFSAINSIFFKYNTGKNIHSRQDFLPFFSFYVAVMLETSELLLNYVVVTELDIMCL